MTVVEEYYCVSEKLCNTKKEYSLPEAGYEKPIEMTILCYSHIFWFHNRLWFIILMLAICLVAIIGFCVHKKKK